VVTLVAVVGIVALLFDVPTTVRRKLHGGRSASLTNL
jgi:hypothetical protein